MPFLSVIIPVYQSEKYLPVCIDSILQGLFQDFEMILVDDGSTDRGPDICDEYEKKDGRIHVIHQKNGGVVSARKTGVRQAKGIYVTFVDSDDYIGQGYEKLFTLAETEKPDVLCSRMVLDGPKGQTVMEEALPAGIYGKEQIEKLLFQLPYKKKFGRFSVLPSCSNKWFKRELITGWLLKVPENISIGEDLSVTYPCICAAGKIMMTDVAYYHYAWNEASMTKKYTGCEQEIKKVDIFYGYVKKLSLESFGPSFFHQMDLYRIRLMLTAFEKEFSKANSAGLLTMFSRVHRMMKKYQKEVKTAVLPKEVKLDFNFKDIIFFWKSGCCFLAALLVVLRKIEKKAGLVK